MTRQRIVRAQPTRPWKVDPVAQAYEFLKDSSGMTAFEIYYYDGKQVIGYSIAAWEAAPPEGLQIVIWESGECRMQETICCLNYYKLGNCIKFGSWMRRAPFLRMLNTLEETSKLLKRRT